MPIKPSATPDNTPIPGGGSWHWDPRTLGWVENTPDQPPPTGDTAPLQTTAEQE